MSFTSTNGPGTSNQVLIAIWFRVPGSSAAAASGNADDDPLEGCLPIMVMGQKGRTPDDDEPGSAATSHEESFPVNGSEFIAVGLTGVSVTTLSLEDVTFGGFIARVTKEISYNLGATWVPSPTSGSVTLTVSDAGSGGAGSATMHPTDPSFIGLNCRVNPPQLVINLESNNRPTISNFAGFRKTYSVESGGGSASEGASGSFLQGSRVVTYETLGFNTAPEAAGSVTVLSDDIQPVPSPAGSGGYHIAEHEQGDSSFEKVGETGSIGSDAIPVSVDRWHSLLVSANFGAVATNGGVGEDQPTKSFTTASAALYVALDDVNYTGKDLGSSWVDGGGPNEVITALAHAIAGSGSPERPNQTYSLSGTIALGGAPIGIPTTAEFSGRIKRIEVSAMQMFTGVSPDLSSEQIRRLFITEPNAKGVQRPARRSKAKKFFGKAAISYYSFGEWEDDATGDIERYKPSANLGGDQGEPS